MEKQSSPWHELRYSSLDLNDQEAGVSSEHAGEEQLSLA